MRKMRISVTLESTLLQQLDALVAEGRFPNRRHAIETAVAEKLKRAQHVRLSRECAKLDPREEKALAGEGVGSDPTAWPEY